MIDWEDIIAVGMGELGLGVEEIFCLSWVEWEYKIEHYRITNARNYWEPARELYSLIRNMFAEKQLPTRELIPLYTDEKTITKKESPTELWNRLSAARNRVSSLPPLSEK